MYIYISLNIYTYSHMFQFSHVFMPLELMAVDTSHTMTSSHKTKIEYIK